MSSQTLLVSKMDLTGTLWQATLWRLTGRRFGFKEMLPMEFSIWSTSGLVGVALYLSAYGGLQLGLLRGSSVTYTVMNMFAAMAVLLSLVEAFNLSSLLIQISWITLSLVGLGRMAWVRSQVRFSDEERAFLSTHFSTLSPHLARKFLRLGRWQSVSPGTVLARQGMPVHELVYVGHGNAEVRAHGVVVAQIGPTALIGEMTIMHGGEATADVEITSEARIFTLPRAALIRELDIDHEFALAVSNALQIEAQRKIEAANRNRAGLSAS
uniref:Cyclic nucleotide-binding domain-containing protein n=2 Tax=Gymnodinialimonas phycosphaerae TaxID=2841589 RepID=A0A975YGC6_9RHOB